MQTIDLGGTWTLRAAGSEEALPATVPGHVFADLRAAGRIPDPFYRDNEKETQWVGKTDWVYSRSFEIDADLLAEDEVDLVCDGLDTIATITLNGREVASTENMHRHWRFPVKPLLRAGENELSIAFRAPKTWVDERQARRVSPGWPVDHIYTGIGHIRKMHCNFGWDWGPKLAGCGIWRPLRLVGWSRARIEEMRIRQQHEAGMVYLDIHPDLAGNPAGLSLAVTLRDPAGNEQTQTLGAASTKAEFVVADPRLWWPNGLGAQPLYALTLTLRDEAGAVLDTCCKRVGLRTLRLVRERDEAGESFLFEVNGARFFAKGVNVIPYDPYTGRATEARHRHVLGSAAEGHANMLRVWGGGIYQDDTFYDVCDELGLLVWQDFLFACAGYPLDESAFRENVRAEVTDAVKRLRHHSCLALWCGNNELELGWDKEWALIGESWTEETMPAAAYTEFFDSFLAGIVAAHDPQTPYWPGSPHTPLGDRKVSNHPAAGDAHLWGVMLGGAAIETYFDYRHRFVSEFGLSSLPAPRVVELFTAPEDRALDSDIIAWHERGGTSTLHPTLEAYFKLPTDFALQVWMTQIYHAYFLQMTIEHFRRQQPRCMGAMHWMLNDVWYGSTNSTVDLDGRWKAPHYAVKQAFAPVLLSGRYHAGRRACELHLNNDTREAITGAAHWTVLTLAGETLAAGERGAAAPALGSVPLGKIALPEHLGGRAPREALLAAKLTRGEADEVVTETVVPLAYFKEMDLPRPGLTWRIEPTGENRWRLHVCSDKPAFYVWFTHETVALIGSDNFFHLLPGSPREITLRALQPEAPRELGEDLKLFSLFDTAAGVEAAETKDER